MKGIVSVLATAGLVATVVLITTGPATAGAAGVVICAGTAEQTHDPGLTLHTQDIHIVSVLTFDGCSDTGAGAGAPITSAVIDVDYVTPASCLVAPPLTTTTVEIEWSGGQQSTAEVTVAVTRTGGLTTVASAGPITSGLFTGGMFSDQVVYPSLDLLDCALGDGVTEIDGSATLEVITI